MRTSSARPAVDTQSGADKGVSFFFNGMVWFQILDTWAHVYFHVAPKQVYALTGYVGHMPSQCRFCSAGWMDG